MKLRRFVTKTFCAFFLVAAFFESSSRLGAFELIGGEWIGGKTTFWINPNFPDTVLSGTREQQTEILLSAAEAWRTQTSADFEFVYGGETNLCGFNLDDDRNVISFVDEDGGDALAATLWRGFDNRIIAFDIVFFEDTWGSRIRWNGPHDPTLGTFDISGVAVHEFGHALGLDHTDILQATMFAGATARGLPLRTLHDDDTAGIEFRYGTRVQDVNEGPTIETVEPPNGPTWGGNEVVIRGSNFSWTADTTLRVGGTTISRDTFEVESLGLIRVLAMPAGSEGPVSMAIEDELGSVVVSGAYRYESPAPALFAVDPPVGPLFGGTNLTIHGENLSTQAVVTIGDAPVEDLTLVDTHTLTGILPPADTAGTVDVECIQGEDTALLPGGFTYTAKVLAIGHGEAAPGEEQVPIDVYASTDEPLSGVSFAFSYDAAFVAITEVTVRGTAAAEAAFASGYTDNDAGVTAFGIIMDLSEPTPNIPIGVDQRVAIVEATISEDAVAGSELLLQVEELAGSPPIELRFTPVGRPDGVRPFAVDGSVAVIQGARFLRGDVNGNEMLEIADAIFILSYLFAQGEEPSCMKAADANDDGRQIDLSDAIYILQFLFSRGPEPPPPFGSCGVDETDDGLTCESFAACE